MKNSKEYIENVKKTESLDVDAIQARFDSNKVFNMLSMLQDVKRAAEVVEQQKKHFFYGREPATNVFARTDSDKQTFTTPDPKLVRLTHAILGMVGEMAEIIEVLEKAWNEKSFDRVNLAEELGDVMWYQAVLCDVLKTNFEDVWDVNIKKLKARYGDKFTEEKANNRDLTKERSLLERETSSELTEQIRLAHTIGKGQGYISLLEDGRYGISRMQITRATNDEQLFTLVAVTDSLEEAILFCRQNNLMPGGMPKDWDP